MAQPQICFAEFAKEEKDLFQIRESLREFAAKRGISPSAEGNFCKAKFPAVYRLATKGLLVLDPANF